MNDFHAVFIDDLTEGAAVRLKNLEYLPGSRPFPLNKCERTEHFLPSNNIMQKNLRKIKKFTDQNLMVINENKSKIMVFNIKRSS